MLVYAPQGYLLFLKDRTLMAQPFDAKAIKTTGEPVPLAEQIGTDAVGLARFSVSRDGVLAYRTGESGGRLLWMDRSGKELDTLGDPAEYQDPDFSPAGDRLAFDLTDTRSGKTDIWIRDLSRGVNSRFTFGQDNSFCPRVVSPRRRDRLRLGSGRGVRHLPEGDERERGGEAPGQVGRARHSHRAFLPTAVSSRINARTPRRTGTSSSFP